MKIFRLPPVIKALIFDMDLTLYSNIDYARCQIDILIQKMSECRGLSFEQMKREVEEARAEWAASHGGKKPSLTNIMSSYGITIQENIRWREESYEPHKFITEDKRLRKTLEELSRFYTLGVVTNNPVLVARKTLAALGVGDCIPCLVGLDSCLRSKPDKMPFMRFSEISACPSETCVSIGDRYDIDLDIPLELGMGAILVNGVEDVYELPGLLGLNLSERPN